MVRVGGQSGTAMRSTMSAPNAGLIARAEPRRAALARAPTRVLRVFTIVSPLLSCRWFKRSSSPLAGSRVRDARSGSVESGAGIIAPLPWLSRGFPRAASDRMAHRKVLGPARRSRIQAVESAFRPVNELVSKKIRAMREAPCDRAATPRAGGAARSAAGRFSAAGRGLMRWPRAALAPSLGREPRRYPG